MQTIEIPNTQAQSVEAARRDAVTTARESLDSPVVLSWRDDRTNTIAPQIPGAATDNRWEEYGEANGGKLEVHMDGDYHFVLGDASEFEEPDVHFANLVDDQGVAFFSVRGNYSLHMSSLLRKSP